MGDNYDVIMAGYPAVEAAQKDFDGLVQLVKDKKVRTEGVILVEHDEDGQVKVSQTGDHLGRKGIGWGGGVGLVVGLFSPPLLGSIVVGAAAGGSDRQVRQAQGRERPGERPRRQAQAGHRRVIAMVDDDDRLAAEQGARRHAGQVGRPRWTRRASGASRTRWPRPR